MAQIIDTIADCSAVFVVRIDENPVIIYMKGTPQAPECGFSAKAVQILSSTGIDFAYVNVLQAPFIYERLPAFSRFPTFRQVYIGQEHVGACRNCDKTRCGART
jgi:monothiol glutaredoxin